jgi:hypothetical protein
MTTAEHHAQKRRTTVTHRNQSPRALPRKPIAFGRSLAAVELAAVHGGSESSAELVLSVDDDVDFAGQTIRLHIASTNNSGK